MLNDLQAVAAEYATQWARMGLLDNEHLGAVYNQEGSWGLISNLYMDRLLGTNVVDKRVRVLVCLHHLFAATRVDTKMRRYIPSKTTFIRIYRQMVCECTRVFFFCFGGCTKPKLGFLASSFGFAISSLHPLTARLRTLRLLNFLYPHLPSSYNRDTSN